MTTTLTTNTLVVAAESSFLTGLGFWDGLWKVGAVIMALLAVAGAYGTTGSVAGTIFSCIWRIPVVLIAWTILWFIIMTIGVMLGIHSEHYANRNDPNASAAAVTCETIGRPDDHQTTPCAEG